ncbi:MAG: hypothetical protein M3O64_03815 [Chloroflexota bacterium]|nr:hypothetical protein [Chloroflexota bacterium]
MIKVMSVIGLALIAVALWGCGGPAAPERVITSNVPAPVAAATTTAPITASTSVPSAAKVSANTATSAELTAAFTAAGISNPASWTREVIEYRPYAADDASFTKLRNELVKYNPAPGVVDKIVATLKP